MRLDELPSSWLHKLILNIYKLSKYSSLNYTDRFSDEIAKPTIISWLEFHAYMCISRRKVFRLINCGSHTRCKLVVFVKWICGLKFCKLCLKVIDSSIFMLFRRLNEWKVLWEGNDPERFNWSADTIFITFTSFVLLPWIMAGHTFFIHSNRKVLDYSTKVKHIYIHTHSRNRESLIILK